MPYFADLTAAKLARRIEAYFRSVEDKHPAESKHPGKSENQAPKKSRVPDIGPVTISGLAYFLGFESREAFADYEANGEFADLLKRARLRIEAAYEKKLHQQTATGAIFALKSMGWDEKIANASGGDLLKSLKIEIINTGSVPAENEQDVDVQ
jgi:hypothetical protein